MATGTTSGGVAAHFRGRRHERASANRWHLVIRLEGPDQVDAELKGWLKAAYALAG